MNTHLRVAVCTNRSPAAVSEALAALRREVPEGRLALILNGVGGDGPSLGHSGSHVFFGEEDAAQRALVRLGYGVRYVPDAAVEHVIPAARLERRSFVRRRFWFGAALGMRGGRSRALAARQALASTAGALAATATGRQALAMERAVRAAENLGVLSAPAVARRRR